MEVKRGLCGLACYDDEGLLCAVQGHSELD